MAVGRLSTLVANPFLAFHPFGNNAATEEEEIGCERKCPCTGDAVNLLFSNEAGHHAMADLREHFGHGNADGGCHVDLEQQCLN